MKLREVLSQYRYDYKGVFECEFCGSYQLHTGCYSDYNFDTLVIPAIKCVKCNKQTNEKLVEQRNQEGIPVKLQKIEVDRWIKE